MADLVEVSRQLAEGEMAREEATDWATSWLEFQDSQYEVGGHATWKPLIRLSGADHKVGPGPEDYLYGPEDFKAWLDDLPGE